MATFFQTRLSALAYSLTLSVLGMATGAQSAQAFTFVNSISIPGNATDLSSAPNGNSANTNRLGGFGSDLYYDRDNQVFYGVVDRGPGGGTIPYNTRVDKFTVDIDSNSGGISNFKLLSTILFTDQAGKNFDGLDPLLLNGAANVLGRSLDPEGFALAPNGNFYVSDEYGPSVKEFTPAGKLVRQFETPANILPKDAQGNPVFSGASSVTVATGRQANRGYEGLAITPDGSKLIAVLQDPLTQEGTPNGRSSRNVRLVVFDAATGKSTAQYVYPLETVAEINERIPGTKDDFATTAQGRNIGVSSIVALNDHEFIVLERDNRGVGVDDPTGKAPVGSKRTFKIDITGATDVSNISLTGSNNAIAGVKPVGKSLYFDIQALLAAAGQTIPDKVEGFAIGPKLANGSYSILVASDNDFSVTQNATGLQFDVCTNGANIALDAPCPAGSTLLPSYLYAFTATAAELGNYVAPTSNAAVPEPTTMTGMALAGLGSLWLKRRKKSK